MHIHTEPPTMEEPASTQPAPAADKESASSLPVIDLADPDAAATAARLRSACMEHGFFYLIGHGIDPALMDAALKECRALFALPVEEKLAMRPPPEAQESGRGYSPYQSEMLNPQEQRQPCTQESFRLKLTTGHGAEADAAARASHPWPDPAVAPGFRTTLEAYHEALEAVAYRVTQRLLEAVGLDPDHLHDAFHPCSATTRLLHYPPVVSDPAAGVLACGSHTDWGCLTLLLSDDEAGSLEVQRRSDHAWVPAPSRRQELPSPLICNVGDMLQRWTNDTLRSTPHRVVNRQGRDRCSIPFFYAPRVDAVVACLPPFRKGAEGQEEYPPIVVGDYFDAKFRAITAAAAAASAGSN